MKRKAFLAIVISHSAMAIDGMVVSSRASFEETAIKRASSMLFIFWIVSDAIIYDAWYVVHENGTMLSWKRALISVSKTTRPRLINKNRSVYLTTGSCQHAKWGCLSNHDTFQRRRGFTKCSPRRYARVAFI